MEKILIFGGSFDPIHSGHIKMACRAADYISADRILLIPAKVSPHKIGFSPAADRDRLNMCALAAKADSRIEVSDIEIALAGVSYTVRTLELLTERYRDSHLYFLMGADMLLCFDRWKNPERILELAEILAVPRNDGEAEILRNYANQKFFGKNITVIECEKIDISSTEIRKSISNGDGKSKNMLPDGVYEYIINRGLYRSETT